MDAKDRKKTFSCEGTGCKCWGVGCPEVIAKIPEVGQSGLVVGCMPNFKGFADAILDIAYDGMDIDGGDAQEIGIEFGLLKEEIRSEPCGDNCRCEDVGDFPLVCFRKTY